MDDKKSTKKSIKRKWPANQEPVKKKKKRKEESVKKVQKTKKSKKRKWPANIEPVKKKKKRKEESVKVQKPKIIPHSHYLFRVGQHTKERLKISNITDLILFASLQDVHPRCQSWCQIEGADKVHKVVIVLVSGVGAKEFLENKDNFPKCSSLFELGINTKASGTYFSVKLPHESLLFIDMPKEQRKKLRKRLEKSDSVYTS